MLKESHSKDSQLKILSYKLNLHPIIASILLDKMPFNINNIYYFLFGDFYSMVSPFSLYNLRLTIEYLRKGIDQKKEFYIVGDKDVDGTTSIAMLVKFFKQLGITVYYNLPLDGESYGFSERIYQDIINKKNKLHCVITVDCGIKEHSFIAQLKKEGITTVITDHHTPINSLPDTVYIINPHLNVKHFFPLCGASISFKLIQGLFFTYTEYYQKKVVYISKLNNIYIYSIVDDIFTPINKIIKSENLDFLLTIKNSVQFIISSQILKNELRVILKEDKKKIFIIEEIYYQYTNYKGSLENILKKEIIFFSQLKPLTSFSLLIRKIIMKYKFDLEKKLQLYLEYSFIATVSDRMSFNDYDNRIFAKTALKIIKEKLDDSFFKFFYSSQKSISLSNTINRIIPFQIAPLINCAGRLGKANMAVEFLINPNYQLLEELKIINKERQKLQTIALDEINNYINKYPNVLNSSILIYHSFSIIKGITGILASYLTNKYHKPCIIIAKNSQEQIGVGSCRSTNHNIYNILTIYQNYFQAFGGHSKACGFSIQLEKIQEFQTILDTSLKDLDNYLIHSDHSINISVNLKTLDQLFFQSFNYLLPFGTEFENTIFSSNIVIHKIVVFGKNNNHIKILTKENSSIVFIIWKGQDNKSNYNLLEGSAYYIQFYLEDSYYIFNHYSFIIHNIKQI